MNNITITITIERAPEPVQEDLRPGAYASEDADYMRLLWGNDEKGETDE